MSERNKVVPDSMLSKEFLSQFKTEADVSAMGRNCSFKPLTEFHIKWLKILFLTILA